jgi:hypothetical protein
MIGWPMRRALVVLSVALLSLAACVDTASAQLPARVATPYTLMDDETRLQLQGGVEVPVRGNGLDRVRLLLLHPAALPR